MGITPYIKTGCADSNVFIPFLKVSGINGTLTGLAVCGGPAHHYVRIGIDGRQIVEDFLCGCLGVLENNGIGKIYPSSQSWLLRSETLIQPLLRVSG